MSTCILLSEIAQDRCDSTEERMQSQAEIRIESEMLFQTLLMHGPVFWRRASTGNADITETFRTELSLEEARTLTRGMRYFRFRCEEETSFPVQSQAGVYLYRNVQMVAGGPGAGRRALLRESGAAAPLLPMSRTLSGNASRGYRIPIPHALSKDPSWDCGRAVRAALAQAPGWIEASVLPLPLPGLAASYRARILMLLGETGWTDQANQEIGIESFRQMLTEGRFCRIEIQASDARMAEAFLCDHPSGAFTTQIRPLPAVEILQMMQNRSTLLPMLEGMQIAFSSPEAVSLLTPSFSLGDALPATRHFRPLYIPRIILPTFAPSSKCDIALARQDDGVELGLTSSVLSQGVAINAASGGGKTETVRNLIRGIVQAGGNFPIQVVDPVGYEYRALFEKELQATVLDVRQDTLTFNPFWAPRHVDLETYSRYLGDFLSSEFSLTERGRQYMRVAVRDLYVEKLTHVTGKSLGRYGLMALCGEDQRALPASVPTFHEFLDFAPACIRRRGEIEDFQKAYEVFADCMDMLAGSRLDRILSGSQPIYGLFDRSFLLMLGGIADKQAQSTLMSLVIGLLLLYRRRVDLEYPNDICGLLVLEEAQRVCPRHTTSSRGKETVPGASETLATLIADAAREVRKFGLGLVVVTQSLAELAEEIRANVGSTIALKTQRIEDQEILSRMMSLSPRGARSLADLEIGQAVLRFSGWRAATVGRVIRRAPLSICG